MGWGFYEMSGGADFEPGAYITAHNEKIRSERPVTEMVARADTSSGTLMSVGAVSAEPKFDELGVTLVSADVTAPAPRDTQEAEMLAALVASNIAEAETTADIAVGGDLAAALDQDGEVALEDGVVLFSMDDLNATAPAREIRTVTGSRVNMRNGPGTNFSVVTKLSRGQEVVVLQNTGDGWLKLQVVDTNRIGWMADFLVTASAD